MCACGGGRWKGRRREKADNIACGGVVVVGFVVAAAVVVAVVDGPGGPWPTRKGSGGMLDHLL